VARWRFWRTEEIQGLGLGQFHESTCPKCGRSRVYWPQDAGRVLGHLGPDVRWFSWLFLGHISHMSHILSFVCWFWLYFGYILVIFWLFHVISLLEFLDVSLFKVFVHWNDPLGSIGPIFWIRTVNIRKRFMSAQPWGKTQGCRLSKADGKGFMPKKMRFWRSSGFATDAVISMRSDPEKLLIAADWFCCWLMPQLCSETAFGIVSGVKCARLMTEVCRTSDVFPLL
jgi:hypothetical protein